MGWFGIRTRLRRANSEPQNVYPRARRNAEQSPAVQGDASKRAVPHAAPRRLNALRAARNPLEKDEPKCFWKNFRRRAACRVTSLPYALILPNNLKKRLTNIE